MNPTLLHALITLTELAAYTCCVLLTVLGCIFLGCMGLERFLSWRKRHGN